MSFFDLTDYREAIRDLVNDRKLIDPEFGFHAVAKSARIQRSYLSKVLSGIADLSHDQLYLVGEALRLDDERMQFLDLLLSYARSSVGERKKKLKHKIDAIAADKRRITENLNAKAKVVTTSTSDDFSSYYIAPWTQIVHVALFIPRYAKDVNLLRSLLNLTAKQMQKILDDLVRMNLVTIDHGICRAREDYL